jgi:hypothetical protein
LEKNTVLNYENYKKWSQKLDFILYQW